MPRVLMLILLVALTLGATLPVAAQGPQLMVHAPANGAVLQGNDVPVSFHVEGLQIVTSSVPLSEAGKHPEANRSGEGHVHFMLDLQPLVAWYTADTYTFTNVPPGEHQLMVELVENDHSSFRPPLLVQLHFRTQGPQPQPAAGTGPALKVLSLTNGVSLNGPSVGVAFQVSGLKIVPSTVPLAEAGKHPEVNRPGEGHLHFMLDLQPLVVWYKNDPYQFTNVPPGEHLLMIELVNNDHSSLSPPVLQLIRFRILAVMPPTGSGSEPETWQTLLFLSAGLFVVGGLSLLLRRKS